jgi:hypothetical protein
MSTPSSAPVIPDHFDLDFLLNPKNRPLFIRAFSGPKHKYLEEQYHILCELQDTILKLDNLLKFTINNVQMRGISALIFAIKDLRSAHLHLQTTLRKRTMHQGCHRPYPPAPATTPLQNLSFLRTSNELSSRDSTMEDVTISLNQPKCAPPNQNTPSAIPIIDLSATTPPLGMLSSPFTNEVPPLLVNKVFPAYMRRSICFQCQRTGHFKSFCPYYRCENCKRPSPQHYPKNCPFHHVDSSPYHSEDNDEEEDNIPDQLDDDDFDDDLGGNGAWGNILGEPVNN